MRQKVNLVGKLTHVNESNNINMLCCEISGIIPYIS